MVSSPAPTSALAPSSSLARALVRDQLELVRLVRELGPGLVVADRPAAEPLPLLDDRGHGLLQLPQILGRERLGHVEVVVEAVGDRGPDAQLGLRVPGLHRLGGDVGGRVPQDGQALGAVDAHGLDLGPLGDGPVQVAHLAVDAYGHDGLVVAVEVEARGVGRGHRLLAHSRRS